MFRPLISLVITLCLPSWLFSEELETFTNEAGQSIRAELIELSDNNHAVTMRLESGLKIEALVSAFSKEDQQRILRWWEQKQAEKALLSERDRINVTVKLNRKSKSNGRYDGYWNVDDKTKAFFPEIVLENEELNTFTNNEIRVIIVATDLRYTDQKLIVSASTIKTDLRERSETFLEGTPFRLRQYEYDSSYSNYEYKYGYEYEGYVVVIKNSKGEITHTRASRSKYLSNIKTINNCEAGEIYGEDLNHKMNASPSSYYVR